MTYLKKDVLTTLQDINDKKSKLNIYIAVVDGDVGACSVKVDFDKFLREFDSTDIISGSAEVHVLYGLVLNIKELPYKIPDSIMSSSKCERSLYLLIDEGVNGVSVHDFESMEEATNAIEHTFRISNDEDLSLGDFVLIVGEELELSVSTTESGNYINPKDVEKD